MKQRGRKSAASLDAITVDGSPDRLQPPDHLSADERQRFTEIVSNCDARHFRPSDTTLLCRFVEADALAEKAAAELRKNPVIEGNKPSAWLAVQEKNVRALVSLSMRLRLSPQSRIDAQALGRQQPRLTVTPWEWAPGDTRTKARWIENMQRDENRKRKYFALMARFNQLGRLLPALENFDPEDAAAVAEARLIISEMNKTQAKMEALSARRRQ